MDVTPPVARTPLGELAGRTVSAVDGATAVPVHVFRGVPYAQPPVGQLRFAPPVAVASWTGLLHADEFGPLAPQIPGFLETMGGAQAPALGESNCLTLNVWTPSLDGAQRPVMVWIHGGAYLTGGGALPWYDGTRLAGNGDVVVVTVNYRLGAFGYLQLDDAPGSGSAGLSDQLEALRWVQANISAFGGDPQRVTVFGESAGAMSIGALLGTPSAHGLFRRAILQSGACAHVHTRQESADIRERFLVELGSPGATVEELRALPEAALIEAQGRYLAAGRSGTLPFQPVIGDGPLLEPPLNVIAANRGASPEAVLHGTNQDEMRLFTSWDPSLRTLDRTGLLKRAVARHGDRASDVVDRYAALRPDLSMGELWSAMETDAVFRSPAQQLGAALRSAGVATWQYLFAWPTPLMGGRLGACHALEIPFVFDNLHQQGAAQFLGPLDQLTALSQDMHLAWLAFAHGGPPRSDWATEDDDRAVWRFHTDGSQGAIADPFGDERSMWP